MMDTEISELMECLDLGAVLEEPKQVAGGLLHKMYRVDTDKGAYAVKVLNPEIMKLPAALRNMVYSEKIAAAFKPVIPALWRRLMISACGKRMIR